MICLSSGSQALEIDGKVAGEWLLTIYSQELSNNKITYSTIQGNLRHLIAAVSLRYAHWQPNAKLGVVGLGMDF